MSESATVWIVWISDTDASAAWYCSPLVWQDCRIAQDVCSRCYTHFSSDQIKKADLIVCKDLELILHSVYN